VTGKYHFNDLIGDKSMPYTIPFTQIGKNNILTAGGKGANLGEMSNAGLPVPPGFVLITEAYDAFVNENGLQQQIINLASTVLAGDPELGEDASTAIKELFLTAEMPDAIKADLLDAYANLTREGEVSVAVRSSATAEDLPTASFAGQHDTFLNIQGHRELLVAVKKCWASLWTARAISYRMRQEIDQAAVSLAVVIQELIPASFSGILFTANPLDGDRDQIVINATWGLGEAIVAGQVTPDTVIVHKPDQQILSRETSTKTMMTVRTATGTEEQPVPQARQNQQVLDDATAVELAQVGAQIEAHYGLPMDIEWAICGGKISILQARPITNLPPAPLREVRWEPLRPGSVWMRRQVVEHMPEPLSPLFDELYLQEGLDQSMKAFADFMSDLSGLKIDIWEIIQPPFATTVNGYAYSLASFEISPKLIPFVFQIYIMVLPKMIRHLYPRWRDESLPSYRARIDYWKSLDLAGVADEELLRGIRELAYEDANYWFAAAVPLGLARITDSALDAFLKRLAARQGGANGPRPTSGAYLWGFPSKTVEAQVQLEAIAKKILGSDPLRDEILETPASNMLQMLAAHPEGQSVLADLQDYLDAYGHQVYNLDFAAPTLADDPVPVLLSLKTAVQHPERDARARQAQLAQERDVLVTRTEQSLNPILRPVFRRLLNWAQRYAPIREEALFYVGAAWPALRRSALELGQRLTAAGSLNAADDVFFLRTAELASASAARADGLGRPELAKLAQERRTLREARKRLDPPIVVPPDGRMKFGPIDLAMFEPKTRVASTGPTLEGFAVSPGQVTAPASLIRSPAEFDQMTPDTILVCTTTTPAWTPLFAQAKGLVTDIGGALAHGSIVAREYGIPAVMGTGAATQRIKNDQRIRVDGDAGTVTLVDEIDVVQDEMMRAQQLAEKKAAARQRKALLALAAGIIVVLAVWWRKRR
jgi:pyruvate,water dikinase